MTATAFYGGFNGDVHTAVASGLTSSIVLVGVAFLIGVVDLLRPTICSANHLEILEAL